MEKSILVRFIPHSTMPEECCCPRLELSIFIQFLRMPSARMTSNLFAHRCSVQEAFVIVTKALTRTFENASDTYSDVDFSGPGLDVDCIFLQHTTAFYHNRQHPSTTSKLQDAGIHPTAVWNGPFWSFFAAGFLRSCEPSVHLMGSSVDDQSCGSRVFNRRLIDEAI